MERGETDRRGYSLQILGTISFCPRKKISIFFIYASRAVRCGMVRHGAAQREEMALCEKKGLKWG